MNLNLSWLIVILLFAGKVSAQSWNELYADAKTEFEKENYEQALTKANQSLLIFLNEPDKKKDNHAALLRLLQLIYFQNNEYEKGLALAEQERDLFTSEKDVHFANASTQVGTFHQALANYEKAAQAFVDAVTVYKHFYKETDPVVVECDLSTGINYYLQDKTEEAYSIFKKALVIPNLPTSEALVQASFYFGLLCQEKLDHQNALINLSRVAEYYNASDLTNTVDYAALMTTLAVSFQASGELLKAEESYGKAQATYAALNELGKEYYQLINKRTQNLKRLGRNAEAEKLMSSISVSSLQGETAAVVYANLANIAFNDRNFAEAEKNYRSALSQLDKGNPSHLTMYNEYAQNFAVSLSESGKHEEAIQLLETISVAPGKEYTLAIKKGNIFLKDGLKAPAKNAYNVALQQLASLNKKYNSDWAAAMNGLASVYTMDGKLASADSVFTILLDAYRTGKTSRDGSYPTVLVNVSSIRQMQGQSQSAYDLLFESSKFLKREAGVQSIAYATILENLAHLNINRGFLTVAKPQIDSALLLFEKLDGGSSITYAGAQITLGRYFQHAGDFPAAEPCFKKAYLIFKELKNPSVTEQIRSINALAIFYQTMGNYEAAEPLLKESITILEKSKETESSEYSTTLQNLATLYQFQGKFDEAAGLLEKTLTLDQKIFGENHPQYAIALKNLGILYQKQGKFNNAQILLERALQVNENAHGKDHPSYAITVSNLAALYQDQGKYKEAERAWQQSVALRKKLLGEEHPDYARSLYGLANIYFAQGNLEQAGNYFHVVTQQYLKQVKENFPSMSEKEKGAFYLKIKPVFEGYQDFCIQYVKQNPQSPKSTEIILQLYNVQLATKAILLNSSSKVRQQILSSNDAELVGRYRQWLELKEKIGRYYTLTAEERKGHEKISVLQEQSNDLEKQLSKSSSSFKNQFSQQEIDVTQIVKALQPTEAAVEIIRIKKKFKTDSVYYVGLIVKANQAVPTVVIWPDGAKLENRFYKYYRNTIKFHLNDTLSYNRFWKPIEKELAGIDHLFVSSDGIFNKVNLSSLQNPKTKKWVIEDFKISLVSNTKEIPERLTADHALTKDVHLYGYIDFNLKMDQTHHASLHPNLLTRTFGFDGDIPILPGTDKEVDDINNILKEAQWNVMSHKRADATEESIKKIQNPKVLHVATHGFFMNDVDLFENEDDESAKFLKNPLLRSGLLLAAAGVKEDDKDATTVEDGILTAYEAMNLTLDNTDLIVMSACETGLGEIRNGEGVYGLQRSFLVAGASAVMMSLWQVDDTATQELMVNFYKHWMSGDHKLDAFRKAQLAMKEKYQSPFFWGAFILVGY
jgi:CHAT domain-containing protein